MGKSKGLLRLKGNCILVSSDLMLEAVNITQDPNLCNLVVDNCEKRHVDPENFVARRFDTKKGAFVNSTTRASNRSFSVGTNHHVVELDGVVGDDALDFLHVFQVGSGALFFLAAEATTKLEIRLVQALENHSIVALVPSAVVEAFDQFLRRAHREWFVLSLLLSC